MADKDNNSQSQSSQLAMSVFGSPFQAFAPPIIAEDYSKHDPRFSDFQFQCKNGVLYFYKREMAGNDVMKALCSSGNVETETNSVEEPYTKEDFNVILNYIDSKVPDKNFVIHPTFDLLYLSDMYHLDNLKERIKKWILYQGDFSWYPHVKIFFFADIKQFMVVWVSRLQVTGLTREQYFELFEYPNIDMHQGFILFTTDGHKFGEDVQKLIETNPSLVLIDFANLAKIFGPESYAWIISYYGSIYRSVVNDLRIASASRDISLLFKNQYMAEAQTHIRNVKRRIEFLPEK